MTTTSHTFVTSSSRHLVTWLHIHLVIRVSQFSQFVVSTPGHLVMSLTRHIVTSSSDRRPFCHIIIASRHHLVISSSCYLGFSPSSFVFTSFSSHFIISSTRQLISLSFRQFVFFVTMSSCHRICCYSVNFIAHLRVRRRGYFLTYTEQCLANINIFVSMCVIFSTRVSTRVCRRCRLT